LSTSFRSCRCRWKRERGDPVEAHACAIRRGCKFFRAVAAVDLDGVDVATAFVEIGVVAGVPDRAIVASFAEDLVIGIAAGQRVVARAAEERSKPPFQAACHCRCRRREIIPRASGQDVVAGAAEEHGGRQRAVDFASERGRCRPNRTRE
jgi:hypothetical protein